MGFSYGVSVLNFCRPIKKHGMAALHDGVLNYFLILM
jgi:hypothetical protein